MPRLNRFPLLGRWAEEAARRLGYTKAEAEALGHAYAVLYAIRARGKPKRAAAKFPEGYYAKLQQHFRRLLKTYPPRRLNSRLLYDLYDEWKQSCGVGRLVDLDKLLAWCDAHARS